MMMQNRYKSVLHQSASMKSENDDGKERREVLCLDFRNAVVPMKIRRITPL